MRVTQLTGVPDGSLRWIVGRSRRRPRSIIFPLRAVSRTGPVAAAFYKQLWVRPGDSNAQAVRSEFVRAVTARSVALTNKVAAVAVRENIWLAPILAADLDRPAMITMKVPGRPLGKTVWSALAPGRRRALTAFLRLGRAIRLIEAATAGDVTPDERYREQVFLRLARRGTEFLSARQREALERRFRELYAQAVADGDGIAHVHGDLAPGNILVSPDGIGLVDFEWPIRFYGYDLVSLIHRLEVETPRWTPWVSSLTRALFEGYGQPDIREKPSWLFMRLERLLRSVTAALGKSRRRPQAFGRLLAELKAQT